MNSKKPSNTDPNNGKDLFSMGMPPPQDTYGQLAVFGSAKLTDKDPNFIKDDGDPKYPGWANGYPASFDPPLNWTDPESPEHHLLYSWRYPLEGVATYSGSTSP
jgi:hypothetical protein